MMGPKLSAPRCTVGSVKFREARRARVIRRLIKAYLSDPAVPPEAWNGPDIDKAAGFHVHVYDARTRVSEGYISNGTCTGCGEVTDPALLARWTALTTA